MTDWREVDPDLSNPAVVRALIADATRVTRAEQEARRKRTRDTQRLIKWESARRLLRRHGLTVPSFMLPQKGQR